VVDAEERPGYSATLRGKASDIKSWYSHDYNRRD